MKYVINNPPPPPPPPPTTITLELSVDELECLRACVGISNSSDLMNGTSLTKCSSKIANLNTGLYTTLNHAFKKVK